jgi:hypothetical protein
MALSTFSVNHRVRYAPPAMPVGAAVGSSVEALIVAQAVIRPNRVAQVSQQRRTPSDPIAILAGPAGVGAMQLETRPSGVTRWISSPSQSPHHDARPGLATMDAGSTEAFAM